MAMMTLSSGYISGLLVLDLLVLQLGSSRSGFGSNGLNPDRTSQVQNPESMFRQHAKIPTNHMSKAGHMLISD